MAKRLFIAVDINERTREQIDEISKALRAAVDKRVNATWVRPDRMHLTMFFFGSADAELEHRIGKALATPIREQPFDLTFGGLGFFPDRGSPRVLWLGIQRGGVELRRTQQELQQRLQLPAEREPFSPHLTLARFRQRVPRERLAEIGDIPASAGPSRIDRVTLYESRLSPAGPTYVGLAEAVMHP